MWTEKWIKARKPKDKRYRLTENTTGRGTGRLVLDVLPSNQKDFYFQYFFDGKRNLIKIGSFRQSAGDTGYTLSEARERYRELSDVLKQGFDVKSYIEEQALKERERIKTHDAKKLLGTFRQLIDSYLNNMELNGKRSHPIVRRSLNRYVINAFPELMTEKANAVTPTDIKMILGKMMDDGITTQSNRVRSYLHTAFAHGIKDDNNPRHNKDDDVMFDLKVNPVSSVPKQADFEYVGNHVITEKEIPIIWNELPKQSLVVGAVVKLGLATGIRTGELVRLKVTDFNLKDETMIIPAAVSKNGIDHLVPLNKLAMSVVKELFKTSGKFTFAFPGYIGRGYRDDIHIHNTSVGTAVREFCEDQEDVEKFTPQHDIRRTVKTLMGKAGVTKEVRDRIQNHALNDVSTVHYDRYDYLAEKRQGLNVWNDYLDLILNPKKNVTHISKKRA